MLIMHTGCAGTELDLMVWFLSLGVDFFTQLGIFRQRCCGKLCGGFCVLNRWSIYCDSFCYILYTESRCLIVTDKKRDDIFVAEYGL